MSVYHEEFFFALCSSRLMAKVFSLTILTYLSVR